MTKSVSIQGKQNNNNNNVIIQYTYLTYGPLQHRTMQLKDINNIYQIYIAIWLKSLGTTCHIKVLSISLSHDLKPTQTDWNANECMNITIYEHVKHNVSLTKMNVKFETVNKL